MARVGSIGLPAEPPGLVLAGIPRRALIALVLAAASWGLGTVVSKRAVEEFAPFTLLVIQLATSVAALGVAWILARRRGSDADGDGRRGSGRGAGAGQARALDRLGLLNPGVAYALSLVGLTQITASLSVLLWAAEPILILGLAWLWLREPLSRRLVGLSFVALFGMALVVWAPGIAGQGTGILATLAGVGCCAIYSVMTRARLGDAPSTLRVVLGQQAWALGLAVVLLATVTVWTAGGAPTTALLESSATVSTGGWLSALGSGVVYYGLAYGFYLTALRDVPASLAATAFYLIPVFGVAGGWAFLAEQLEPAQWIGAAVVLAALGAIVRRGKA